MAKRTKNRARTNKRTYRKKKSKISKRKRMNRKRTIKRKNIMIGGSLVEGVAVAEGDRFIGGLNINLKTITDVLKNFGVAGTDSMSSILSDTAAIKRKLENMHIFIKDKVKGNQSGGGFALKFILKKIARLAAFGVLLEVLNYFLVQPNINRIFKFINSKAFLTFDGHNIGICFVIDGEEYKIHLKNSSTFPVWINIMDYIDALLPILIKTVYSNSTVQKVFAAKSEPIKSEEELLHYVQEELQKRKNKATGHEGGGQIGGFPGSALARELYENTKGKLSVAKQKFSEKISKMGDKMKDSFFGNSLIGAACSFFILYFIYMIYEKSIDSNGRWVKLKYHSDTLGVSISKTLGVDEVFIQITTKFITGNIEGKIKELKQESKKQEEEELKVVEVNSEVSTSELSPTSSQAASPPSGQDSPTSEQASQQASQPASQPASPQPSQTVPNPSTDQPSQTVPNPTQLPEPTPTTSTDQLKYDRDELSRGAVYKSCIRANNCDSKRFQKGSCRKKCQQESENEPL